MENPSDIDQKSIRTFAKIVLKILNIDRKSTKNPSEIDPKSHQKEDAILNATWEALGPILDGFWVQNGSVGRS